MIRTFVGFGFGPIQSGLFLYEAFRSGNFDRFVVAEVAGDVVQAIHQAGGKYTINIAEQDRVSPQTITELKIYNPTEVADQSQVIAAIAESSEIATALPAVEFYDQGNPSPVGLLASGLTERRRCSELHNTLIYAAENDLRAADILRERIRARMPPDAHSWFDEHVQVVNTVIGKMSGVVSDPDEMASAHLRPLVEGATRAVLVEEFNHILIECVHLPNFERGLTVFEEKADLLPFEKAKLYGHNAAHALMGYLAQRRGYQFISEVRGTELMDLVRRAFIEESGAALCRRHKNVDTLFSEAGWATYVADLLERMTNPHLRDKVARIVRDPRRKLGWNDRLVGTMRLALSQGIEPRFYSLGAAAALATLLEGQPGSEPAHALEECWRVGEGTHYERREISALVRQAYGELR